MIPEPVLDVQQRIRELRTAPLAKVAEVLQDPDIAVRIGALDALAEIFPTCQDASGYAFQMLDDPCQQVRWRAQQTLGLMVRDKSGAFERYPPRRAPDA
jgi:hypothetical protein